MKTSNETYLFFELVKTQLERRFAFHMDQSQRTDYDEVERKKEDAAARAVIEANERIARTFKNLEEHGEV